MCRKASIYIITIESCYVKISLLEISVKSKFFSSPVLNLVLFNLIYSSYLKNVSKSQVSLSNFSVSSIQIHSNSVTLCRNYKIHVVCWIFDPVLSLLTACKLNMIFTTYPQNIWMGNVLQHGYVIENFNLTWYSNIQILLWQPTFKI